MPEIKINNKTFATQTGAAQPIIADNVKFPAGTIIGAAFLADVTDGYAGTSSTSYTLRSLNTIKYSINLPVTILSNEFTFNEAGSYLIQACAPALKSDRHILRLSEDSGSSFISSGSAAHNGSTANVVSHLKTQQHYQCWVQFPLGHNGKEILVDTSLQPLAYTYYLRLDTNTPLVHFLPFYAYISGT